MNIPELVLRPFGYTGMPTLGLWNTHLGKWVTLREAWDHIYDCLKSYEINLIKEGAGKEDPDMVRKWIEGIMETIDIERCTCKLSLVQHPDAIKYLVFIRYAGRTRYGTITLPRGNLVLPNI